MNTKKIQNLKSNVTGRKKSKMTGKITKSDPTTQLFTTMVYSLFLLIVGRHTASAFVCRHPMVPVLSLGESAIKPLDSHEPCSNRKNVRYTGSKKRIVGVWSLRSNFYDDFEDFGKNDDDDKNDDEDDEDDDDYIEFDEAAIAKFRSQIGAGTNDDEFDGDYDEDDDDDDDYLSPPESSSDIPSDLSSISSVEDLISYATSTDSSSSSSGRPKDWAVPLDSSEGIGKLLEAGVVLLANPSRFCTGFPATSTKDNSNGRPSPALLAKFGLTLPPPSELGPDRRADLLPVLLLLERHPLRGCQALLLNRRTGYLIGDLDQSSQGKDSNSSTETSSPPPLGAFMIQPLWFGGTSSGSEPIGGRGFDMLHLSPSVQGAKRLTDDGLYWGGDPAEAQEIMGDGDMNGVGKILTGFDFKFFVQSTRWLPTQLEKEIRDGTWFVASVSKDILFKSRDRLGSKRAKPLWTEVMELMGGDYNDVRNLLYDDDGDEAGV